MIAFNVDAKQINFPKGHVDYSKVHDEVVAIDPYAMTVTINLINGFSFGCQVWYMSMDASIPLAASIDTCFCIAGKGKEQRCFYWSTRECC
jgi:hypothetical protein